MENSSKKYLSRITHLPDSPGIYIWKNQDDVVIYVGKAKNLKHRIKSYLSNSVKDDKTQRLVQNIYDLEYVITNSENEAFLLEANLIRQHRPKYNILLKDDKRYPFIKITLNEPYPRILVTRDLVKDGSRYFGPYTDSRSLRKTLRSLEWIFPMRNCSRKIPLDKIVFSKACINYQLHKCLAPCIGVVSHVEYQRMVCEVISFFSGRHQDLIDRINTDMQEASEKELFESAAKLRDRLIEIDKIQKKQSVFYTDNRNHDVIGFYEDSNIAYAVVLRVLNGKLLNQESYPLTYVENSSREDYLEAFIKLYYTDRIDLPDEILLPFKPSEFEEMNLWLSGKLSIPVKGDKTKLMIMAKNNAFHMVEDQKLAHLKKANRTIKPIQELKEKLDLSTLPRKMVCMDISTIQGSDTVSSAVFFNNGKPQKKYYRHFIIKSIDKQNDFAAMSETLLRFIEETKKEPDMLPDLIIIDGGKGQLNSAVCSLNGVNQKIPLISIAKRIEEIFIPGSANSIILSKSSLALRLIINIRDEAHRFAINFHRSRRLKRTLISELEEIKGIGEKTKFLLLKEFGSIEGVRMATVEQLTQVKGIGESLAQKIKEHFIKT